MYAADARRCLEIEAKAVHDLISRIDERFDQAVNMILQCTGRVVVSGIGKSGLVGRKIAATLASTGTPAFFLHPSEGLHGDVGMVTANDVVIVVSYSGDTPEINVLLSVLKRLGVQMIAFSGSANCVLVKHANVFLDVHVEKEACPLGLAPTASTTAALAMGDALAMALLSARKFRPEDFALYHPAGSLGRKLQTVAELMHSGDANPLILIGKTVREALFVITEKGLGAVSVVTNAGQLAGIITDGDIRRGFEIGNAFLDVRVEECMTSTPKTISPQDLAGAALHKMEKNYPRPITVLPVVDEENRPVGMIHITHLLRQGMV